MDDIAVIRSCYGDVFDHAPAIYLRNSGSQFPGRPCLGSWVTYGLGTENQNLPAFVVMSDGSTKSGPRLTAPAFCPRSIRARCSAAARIRSCICAIPPGVSAEAQQETLNFIGKLDRLHLSDAPGRFHAGSADRLLRAGVSNAERGAGSGGLRARNPPPRKTLYGIDEPTTDDFGRKCLLARRLVERGVRFIQIYSGTNVGDDWDNAHTDLIGVAHERMAGKTDRRSPGLLQDLKAHGPAGIDAGRLGRRVRAHAAVAGPERPRSSSVRILHVDGGRRRQGRAGARRDGRIRRARGGNAGGCARRECHDPAPVWDSITKS